MQKFLSTLSLRRATLLLPLILAGKSYFYPRSPCGERHSRADYIERNKNFYPRSPCGERHSRADNIERRHISIHALLAESDIGPLIFNVQPRNFYPRSPCGERRPGITGYFLNAVYFYPRSPCGERPYQREIHQKSSSISIHALLAESDGKPNALKSRLCVFLSTLSLRRATANTRAERQEQHDFYPRSPCGERHLPQKSDDMC